MLRETKPFIIFGDQKFLLQNITQRKRDNTAAGNLKKGYPSSNRKNGAPSLYSGLAGNNQNKDWVERKIYRAHTSHQKKAPATAPGIY